MDRKRQVLRLVSEQGPLTTHEVSAELLLDRANASAYLNSLVRSGELKKARRGRSVFYSREGSLPNDTREALPQGRLRDILAYVLAHSPSTTTQVTAELGLDRANASAYLNDLARRGKLIKAQSGRTVYYSKKGVLPDVDSRRPTPATTTQLELASCPRCGFYPDTDYAYCPMCGAGLRGDRSRVISRQVKQAVWRRDRGRCVNCGARESLHYDHVIPFAKGGANTIENIQILCAPCNLKKSDRIE